MATNHVSSSTPTRPTEILDPYPDDVTNLGGVRMVAERSVPLPSPGANDMEPPEPHTPFTASVEPFPHLSPSSRPTDPIPVPVVAMLALTGAAALMATGSTLDSDALRLAALAPLIVALALIVSGLRTAGASRSNCEPLRTGTFTRTDGTTFIASGEQLTAAAALLRRVRSR